MDLYLHTKVFEEDGIKKFEYGLCIHKRNIYSRKQFLKRIEIVFVEEKETLYLKQFCHFLSIRYRGGIFYANLDESMNRICSNFLIHHPNLVYTNRKYVRSNLVMVVNSKIGNQIHFVYNLQLEISVVRILNHIYLHVYKHICRISKLSSFNRNSL